MALHGPSTREFRNQFGAGKNFAVKGAVSLEDVAATLNLVRIEPLASELGGSGALDANARNEQKKRE